jgi:hypothetical protein
MMEAASHPEGGGDMLLSNSGLLSRDCTVLYCRTLQSHDCEKLDPKGRRLLYAPWTEMPLLFLNFYNAKECTGLRVSISILKKSCLLVIFVLRWMKIHVRFPGLHPFYWAGYAKE